MTTPHPDASLLRAIADGKRMQVEGLTAPWADASPDDALRAVCHGEPCRIRPEFVLVNGVECPTPAPILEQRYTVRLMIMSEGQHWDFGFAKLADAEAVCRALVKPFKECQE